MAVLAHMQALLTAYSVADDLLSDLPQKLPMMIAHVGRLANTALILRVGSFEKHAGGVGVLSKEGRYETVSEWDQYNQYWNDYKEGAITAP
jgi:hypothetical protein